LLESPEVADLANRRRAFNDQPGDIFSQQCSRDILRHIDYDLRRMANNEFIRCASQAVLVMLRPSLCENVLIT
jgi:hypothetical protein